MLKILAIAVYTFMTMLFYESRVYKTDNKIQRQALAIIQIITVGLALLMAYYIIK